MTCLQEEIAALNPEQREAVTSIDGRVLVLAGAGSGKTRVLTLRIAHLIRDHGVDPTAIVGLTFTNKAAGEMRERLASLIGKEQAKQVTLATFHSFCMRILREHIDRLGYSKQFTLYDPKDVERIVQQIVRDILMHDSELPSIAGILSAISTIRNNGGGDRSALPTQWQQVYDRLNRTMRAHNAVDFDSLLSLTVQLFQEHHDILEHFHDRFRYLLIDEYQDTNPVQDQLATLLSSRSNNLFVVGDDDQSIYGWRGAEVEHILQFADAKTVRLEQNYRSTNTILRAANSVIGHNTTRHPKQLWSARGEGKPIEVFHAPTDENEAEAVVYRILQMRERLRLSWRDFAILYRSNALSRQMEHALLRASYQIDGKTHRGIPYQIFGGTEFYERREVKDVLAYLRVLVNPCDHAALLRVINTPRRGIGDQALETLTQRHRATGKPLLNVMREGGLSLSSTATGGVQGFLDLYDLAQARFAAHGLAETLEWFMDAVNYEKAIKEEVKSEKMREHKRENLQELLSALAQFEETAETPTLEEFLLSTPLGIQEGAQREKKKGNENAVTLMTFHSAKGLEFPACFLIGLEDHIIPHERSLAEGGIEEERRLMYVAITRAQHHLTCSMAQQRRRAGKLMPSAPSRFLFEIPKDLMAVKAWHDVTVS